MMSLTPSAVESSPVVERPGDTSGSRARWLILALYLLGAVAVTLRLWIDPASRAQVGDPEDVDLFAWFMRYAATAVSHGHFPALFTTAMNAPRGINLMWNTSFLLPSILLSPVTLLVGPQVSLTIALTLGFAGSAASLFWVLGRWGAGIWPAAFGGALYGFSSALVNSSIGHYHIQFAVLPPLIIDAALRIVTGRSRPVRTGVWLGVLIAAQVFIGEELLTLTAVAGLLLIVVVAIGRPRSVPRHVRGAALGLGTAAAAALVICGYALLRQFHGRLKQHGSPWIPNDYASHLAGLVTPSGTLLLHTRASAAAAVAGSSTIPEYLTYLGWPLLVVLVAAAVRYWRDPRVRATAVTFVVLELFTLGGGASELMPWRWLQGLPVLNQVLPDRFAILADGAAAAVLAFSLGLARSAASERPGWARRNWPFAVAALALVPLIPLPLSAGRVSPVPAGWQAAFGRLHLAANAAVLVVPVPYAHLPEPLRWQADTGEPDSIMGGWFVGPQPGGKAVVEYFGPHYCTFAAIYLDDLWRGLPTPTTPVARGLINAALAYWRPAAIIAVTGPHSRLERVLTEFFGRPTLRAGQVLAWRR
jgi:hypothetical protein